MVTEIKYTDPRVKRTRKLLQQAFMELFKEKTFDSISIQDITERATVNRATFYAHFVDKYALMDSIIREQFHAVVAGHLPAQPRWSVNSLGNLIRGTFDFLGEFHHDCKLSDNQFDPLVERAIQQEIADILMGWLKQAHHNATGRRVRLETIAETMSWAIFGTAVQWSRGTRQPSAEEMTHQVLLVLTEGLNHLSPAFEE